MSQKTVPAMAASIDQYLCKANDLFRFHPPVINALIEKYGHHDCLKFALYASRILKKPVVQIRRRQEDGQIIPIHYAVLINDQHQVFDCYGFVDPSAIAYRYGAFQMLQYQDAQQLTIDDFIEIQKDVKVLNQYFALYGVPYLYLNPIE